MRAHDDRAVLLEIYGAEHQGWRDLERLENAHRITATLTSPAVLCPLALERVDKVTALVLPDFEGSGAEALCGTPMPIERFLPLALAAARALADLHDRGILHKDIKPESLLYDERSGELRIIGFGIASLLPREQALPQQAAVIEGSLPYMSPEQTGRLNRAMDQRTDLYSLGVTFFQLLTGVLPYSPEDAAGWVHCQIARSPPRPSELVGVAGAGRLGVAIPAQLEDLVMRLLAKPVEERYQSAAGLAADLQRCLTAWRTWGRIDPFPLGEKDVFHRLQLSQALYGRTAELRALGEALAGVIETGRSRMVLVAGPSGAGKSALVGELRESIAGARGTFLTAKFDGWKPHNPYGTFADALSALVADLRAQSEAGLAAQAQRLVEALGPNAPLVGELLPELASWLGRPPLPAHSSPDPALDLLPELPPEQSRLRLARAILQFVGAFAGRGRPVVLFLDNLQWADPGSLALLEALATSDESHDLLLVAAYRDSDVTPEHPLTRTLERIRQAGALLRELRLGRLTSDDVANLLSDSLHCARSEVAPLAALVHQRTGGDPLFVGQFLAALYRDRLIRFDVEAVAWRWDAERIAGYACSDNVADLMAMKLQELPPTTRNTLLLAACVGEVAFAHELAQISGRAEAVVEVELEQGAQEGLLTRTGRGYQFLHDRVRRAAHALIPGPSLPRVHLRIGRVLMRNTPEGAWRDRLFEMADHFARAAAEITVASERRAVAELLLQAAGKARSSHAYQAGLDFLTPALALLDASYWGTHHQLLWELSYARAECEWQVGNFDEAEVWVAALLAHAASKLELLAAHALRVDLLSQRGRYADALVVGFEGLARVGVELTAQPTEAQIDAAYQRVWAEIGPRRVEDLAGLAPLGDPEMSAVMALVERLHEAMIATDLGLSSLACCFLIEMSLRHGNAPSSLHGYAGFATLCLARGRSAEARGLCQVTRQLLERPANLARRPLISITLGQSVGTRLSPYRECVEIVAEGARTGLEIGDTATAALCELSCASLMMLAGRPLPEVARAVTHTLHSLEVMRRARAGAPLHLLIVLRQAVRALAGQTAALGCFDDGEFDEAAFHGPAMASSHRGGFFARKLQALVFANQFSEAVTAGEAAARLLGGTLWSSIATEVYLFHGLAIAATLVASPTLPGEPDPGRAAALATLQDYRDRLRELAADCPENFAGKRALLAAEIARIDGHDDEALAEFETAVRHSREQGLVPIEALAHETAARYHRARGLGELAALCLREACALYAQWGAEGKVRQLDQLHPELDLAAAAPRRAEAFSTTFSASSTEMDLFAVVQASQAIAGEVLLERVITRLVEVVLEHGGADEGYLLLVGPDPGSGAGVNRGVAAGLRIEGEAFADPAGGIRVKVLAGTPLADTALPFDLIDAACRSRKPVVIADARAGQATRAPGSGAGEAGKRRSRLCLPILRSADLMGVLYLENDAVAGAFTPARLAALDLLAAQAAISLQNARLLSQEQAARAAAEDAGRRLALLAETSALLAESFDSETVLDRLSRLLVRWLADWCIVDLITPAEPERQRGAPPQIRRAASAHGDSGKQAVLRLLQEQDLPRWGSEQPVARVLATGKPVLLADTSGDGLRDLLVDDGHERLVRELGTSSAVAVPLIARGRVLGALSLGARTAGHFGPREVDLIEAVASRIATALDNTALFRETRQAVRLRDEFLSVASHELNRPLDALTLSVQAMLTSEGAAPGVQAVDARAWIEQARTAERQCRRLTRLVREMLDVTQLEEGLRLPLDAEELDLARLLRDVIDQLTEPLLRAQSLIALDAPEPVLGRWDPVRLEQVVFSLLSNAVKFGAGHPVEVALVREGATARLTVTDHGIGIERERQGRIFERFERAASVEKYGGLGLGLYVCRRVVEAHGGEITVESEPGQGARFTVLLPIETAVARRTPAIATPLSGSRRPPLQGDG